MPWIILGVCLVLFLVGIFTGPNARFFYARKGLESKMKKISDKIIVDPKLDHKADYILVSKYGVVLIKMINTSGEYFGSEKQNTWTLISKGKKSTIKNPIRMTEEAKEVLKSEYNIESKVCLIFNFGFTKGINSNCVIKARDLAEYVGNKEIYTDDEVNEIYNNLSKLKKTIVK